MKRLLVYAKPYMKLILLSIVLLLVISVIDLARPYLIKIAIDDHILGINRPYIEAPPSLEHEGIVEIGGRRLIREDRLASPIPGAQTYTVERQDGVWLLTTDTGEAEELTPLEMQ